MHCSSSYSFRDIDFLNYFFEDFLKINFKNYTFLKFSKNKSFDQKL